MEGEKMRLVDADALIKKLRQNKKTVKSGISGMYTAGMLAGIDFAGVTVTQAPTVEERKHGHWIKLLDPNYGIIGVECSACKCAVRIDTEYCPYCGSVMDDEAQK